LGRELAHSLGFAFMDVEDYYFPQSDTNYKYGVARTKDQVNALLLADMRRYGQFVLASVKGNFDEDVRSIFDCAVYLHVSKEIRMQRVYERSYQKFGDRMLPGGDLFEKEQRFLDMVQSRPDNEVMESMQALRIPVIQLDGTLPIGTNVQTVIKLIAE